MGLAGKNMDEFSSLQGRVYELGGVSGTICALRKFKLSEICEQQIERITSQLGKLSLPKIYGRFAKESDISRHGPAESASSILSARLFQGYVQGFCETNQFVQSLSNRPRIAWVFANPSLDGDSDRAFELSREELSRIADLSDFDFGVLRETGTCPYADLFFIVRISHNGISRFHIVAYELSTHNIPNIEDELNLSEADDIRESLKRGKSAMSSKIRSRNFRIASETLGLEISPELKNHFHGMLTRDKGAKKLFQGGGYLYSLFDTMKNRVIPEKPFDKWQPDQGNIEFHVVAFTDRSRHFLHIKEKESKLLREMGEIYKAITLGRGRISEDRHKLREREVLATQTAIMRNIRGNTSPELRIALKDLYRQAKETFSGKNSLPGYLNYAFSEKIEAYCPTGTPPTAKQLDSWLTADLSEHIQQTNPKSMQDAHAEIVRHFWKVDGIDIYVLSGTPGIGKTTALRNILAGYDRGYLLLYVSPRIQVNTDMMAKFDPAEDGNRLAGKDEMICVTSNYSLIRASEHFHGRPALSCRSLKIPDDPKFLFLSAKDAESLENRSLDTGKSFGSKTGYRRVEKGAAREGFRSFTPGVFKTMTQAVHRLAEKHNCKRIVACVSTQSLRQLEDRKTTFSAHLQKIFGRGREFDMASVEKFANKIGEIVFFIDEVTGDRAGRQAVHDIMNFKKNMVSRFREVGRPCPLKFRIIIADASLINASSVESYLNKTQSQPDQILFNGNADRKGLSVENAKIMGLPAKIINANVYPASSLILKWRPVLGFSPARIGRSGDDPVGRAYRELENAILERLAGELLERWRKKPEEQIIVIIQNKEAVDTLKDRIIAYAGDKSDRPDIIRLHAHTPPNDKRDIVSPASEAEKSRKERAVPVSQKGDLADIIIMTSSGTRGISFPNASKIVCIVPTFSLENNFMEFLQGIYRGRGGGKGNRLHREIEIIIHQIFVSTADDSEISKAAQISNLFATQMMLRMSILTRIFGACELFGKSVSCIPISGNLVQGAARSIMDNVDDAIRSLEHAHRRDPGNTALRYIKENIRDIFINESVILHHSTNRPVTLISDEFRKRLRKRFVQDANKGLDIISKGKYIPRGCYTAGELLLQNLEKAGNGMKEKNRHLVETHMEAMHKKIRAVCAKLYHFTQDRNTPKTVRDNANTLLPILNVLCEESETDTESETKGSVLNRWLVVPLSAMHIDNFWKDQPEPQKFKTEMKEMLKDYFRLCLCRPNHILPLEEIYDDNIPPWLLVRGPEIAQCLDAQFRTRYLVSSRSLALLNIMLLGKYADKSICTDQR